ncbi:hypothetical protein CJ030_MR7G002280 [Morella rubra]|uniref:Uncharacterized protein n=1 Tax=Morella rubra TaxID=262757 RepID=A0A6A1V1P2_9ROSI|nr:hypothetical protein CJ030_MR7G002280 [Morella rubra]
MVHIYVHHIGSLSLVNEEYIGGEHSVDEPIFVDFDKPPLPATKNDEGGQGVAGGGLEPDRDGEESSERVEGENEELTRANVMSWFAMGPSITREEEEVPVDIGSSDDITFAEEDRGAGGDEDAGSGGVEDVQYRTSTKSFMIKIWSQRRKSDFRSY